MSYEKQLGLGDGFVSKLTEGLRESLSRSFDGVKIEDSHGTVYLKFVPDWSNMQAGMDAGMGRITVPSSSSRLLDAQGLPIPPIGGLGAKGSSATGAGDDFQGGRVIDELVAIRKGIDTLVRGATGQPGPAGSGDPVVPGVPGAPGSPGGGGAPDQAPGSVFGEFNLHPWEIQQLVQSPIGYGKYIAMAKLAQSGAALLASPAAGSALGAFAAAPFAAAGLAGSSLAAGYGIGSFLWDYGVEGASKDARLIHSDATMSVRSGYDFRGINAHTYEDNRRLVDHGAWEHINLDDARSMIDAYGVNFSASEAGWNHGGWRAKHKTTSSAGRDADESIAEMSSRAARLARDRFGVGDRQLASFMGASWLSGSASLGESGTNTLLKRIAAATEAGAKNGLTGTDSLQSIARLNALMVNRAGSATEGGASYLQKMWEYFQHQNNAATRGAQGAGLAEKLASNQSDQFQGFALTQLMDGMHLSGFAKDYISKLAKSENKDDKGLAVALGDAEKNDPLLAAEVLLSNPALAAKLNVMWMEMIRSRGALGSMVLRSGGLPINNTSLIGMHGRGMDAAIEQMPLSGDLSLHAEKSDGRAGSSVIPGGPSLGRDLLESEQFRAAKAAETSIATSGRDMAHVLDDITKALRKIHARVSEEAALLGNPNYPAPPTHVIERDVFGRGNRAPQPFGDPLAGVAGPSQMK